MQNYNQIHDVQDISSGSGTSEPVSLEEMKAYLRLQGFIDDDDDTSVPDFDDDDDLIELLITSARQRFEEHLSASIVEHTWQAVVTNLVGGQKLPYGPLMEVNSITDSDDNDIDFDGIKVRGDNLVSPCFCNMTVEYEAGYEVVPSGIKEAIMKEVAYRYEHRGEELDDKGICNSAMILLNPYKRASWLI